MLFKSSVSASVTIYPLIVSISCNVRAPEILALYRPFIRGISYKPPYYIKLIYLVFPFLRYRQPPVVVVYPQGKLQVNCFV